MLMIFPTMLALVACGSGSEIKDAVRQHLKDPASVQFKETVISESGHRACVVWNAKNSMGGYGNWDIAVLKKDGSSWVVIDMEGEASQCTESGFRNQRG